MNAVSFLIDYLNKYSPFKNKSMESVKVERRQVTPEYAKQLLGRNDINRSLSDRWVSFYSQQMREGEWRDTTDTIKLAPDGTVLDGQHRLSAVVAYGKPVWMWLAFNVDRDSFTVLDTGRRRSAADVVAIAGHKYATGLSAVAGAILRSPDGKWSRDKSIGSKANTHTAILEFITENPSIHEVVSYAYNVTGRFRFGVTVSLVGALYWHFSRKHQKKADEFFESLCEGIDLSKDHPIRRLRERLMRDAGDRTKLLPSDKAALFVYAWNAYRQNRDMAQLLLPRGADFPKIV